MFVSPFYGELNNAIPRRVLPIINQFLKQDFSVTIITSSDIHGELREKIISTFLKIPSNNTPLPVRALAELLWGLEVGIRIFLRRRFHEDIVVTIPSFFGFLVYTLFVPKRHAKIVDLRDAYPKLLSTAGLLNEKKYLYRQLVKYTSRLINRYDLSTTVSKGLLYEFVNEVGIHKSKIVYNGVDEYLIDIREPKFENFTVVMHGTLGGMQNIDFFVELVNSMNNYDISFIVIGKGPKGDLVKNLNSVRYIDDLKRNEMLKLISRCHLGLSLRNEGWAAQSALPVKVFEYYGLGLPFITAPKSEVSEIFSEKNGCYTLELDIETVRDRIISLSLQRDLETLDPLNLEFTREYQSKYFLKLYYELLDDRRS